MVTFLQRQRVVKRAVPPVRLRTRNKGVRPRRPWLAIGLIVALSALLLAPSIAITATRFPQSRPVMPLPPDLDQELYRILVPEKTQNNTPKAPSALLAGMQVVRYRPQAGDTVSSIAQRFKRNLDTIISWNGIRDPRSIRVGAPLEIPSSDGLKYIVRRGDSLERIARSSRIELSDILDRNALTSSVITAGQELFLPGARMSANQLNGVLGSLFIWPVRGKISSFFGNRPDPFSGVVKFHAGVDIANALGTPIMAAMAGTVRNVGFNSSFGRYIILNHAGYQTMYSHLDRSFVSRGEKVRQGQKIAEMGNSGYSTGPHLDFRIFRNGEALDPLRLLKQDRGQSPTA